MAFPDSRIIEPQENDMKPGEFITTDIKRSGATLRYTLKLDEVSERPTGGTIKATIYGVEIIEPGPRPRTYVVIGYAMAQAGYWADQLVLALDLPKRPIIGSRAHPPRIDGYRPEETDVYLVGAWQPGIPHDGPKWEHWAAHADAFGYFTPRLGEGTIEAYLEARKRVMENRR